MALVFSAASSRMAARHAAPRRAVAVVCPARLPVSVNRKPVLALATAKTASTVKIILQGRKLPVTDSIKEYVQNKISHALQHYVQEVKKVDVTLSARGGDTGTHGKKEQKVDVTVHTVRNGVVRCEESEETLYASIDLVCDKLERKMERVKQRAIAKGKWPGRAGPKDPGAEEAEFKEYLAQVAYETAVFDREEAIAAELKALNDSYPAQVVRSKQVDLVPLTVEEAIDALEAVGHDFYVFRELKTDSVQVVYRRASEGYGVLVPRML